jgi:hypothetical protein
MNLDIIKLTGVLVIVGILQCAVYFFQWLWMIKTLNHTRESSEKGLRAYVGIVWNRGEETKFDSSVVRMRVINCGQTPAYQLKGVYSWQAIPGKNVPWPESKPYTIFKKSGSVATLVPQVEITLNIPLGDSSDGVPYKTFVERSHKGEITLFLYGTFSYDDVFGKTHNTNFCFVHDSTSPENVLTVCSHHNESD